ncbi:MAG TPA: ATP-binding protein [Aliidongia sp.]|nr:ATP-binding protein [Aliidongia sp.]
MRATRVMVVEDERIVAFHLRQRLIKLGYSVVGVVSSGRQTLERVEELQPDVVLMDVHIDGDLDGIETASRLRCLRSTPVIYLTAHAEEATLERARATKPYGFLLKPFSERELHATIQMGLERRAEEDALHANAERFRDFSRVASDWFWEQDAQNRFQWISDSPSLEDRIVEAFAPGKTRWDLIDRGVSRTQWASHRALLERRMPIRDFRFERVDASGRVHYLSVSGNPIIDTDGQFRGYRGTGQDITQRILAERALYLAKEEAESASRIKSQFLANMSHELRTPLNAILGFSELIRDEMMGPISPRYRDYASDIYLAGRHLLRVIGDVLDLSKIEAGQMELCEEWIDLSAVITASRKLILARAEAASVTLEMGPRENLPPIFADEGRIRQVLLNLLANAVKFTPAGGSVRVDAWHIPGDGVVFTVADTGIGMKPEDISEALTPFRQLEGQLARRYEGTGLGLPIAKTLVELHGGTLELESEPGRGTTVRVHLPEERTMRTGAIA